MPLPPCEQFDMGRCPGCPLKDVLARLMIHNQVAERNGTTQITNPARERFLPAHDVLHGLTSGDNDKLNAIMTEDSYYTVDDRDCAGVEEVTSFGLVGPVEKLACSALLVSAKI
ncbi:MAG TPA: hypothetical protein VFH99_01390 [Candidatus Saccharimonadales bacterium]|nr:hypothetical protein [Candidatus Saccharimonadales bacterium]